MTEQSSRVRKAVEAISALPEAHSKEFDEAVESLIERHCHVTEMEAVVEKCRIFIKQSVCHLPWAMPTSIARKERNNWFKRKKEALSSIDALKGDKR